MIALKNFPTFIVPLITNEVIEIGLLVVITKGKIVGGTTGMMVVHIHVAHW